MDRLASCCRQLHQLLHVSVKSSIFKKVTLTENLAVLFDEISYLSKNLSCSSCKPNHLTQNHLQHKAGSPWTESWQHSFVASIFLILFCTAQSASTMRLDHGCACKSCLACTAAFGVRCYYNCSGTCAIGKIGMDLG